MVANLCEFDPEDRFASAAIAKKQFEDLILPEGKSEKNLLHQLLTFLMT